MGHLRFVASVLLLRCLLAAALFLNNQRLSVSAIESYSLSPGILTCY